MAEHDREILLYLLGLLATRPVFPKIYDGFREVDELAKGEDAMLGIMQDCTRLVSSDKLITLANESKLSEWESELGLSGNGMTLEERRAQMAAFLGRSRVINDAALLAIARNAAGSDNIDIVTNSDDLTCQIRKPENSIDANQDQELRSAYIAVRPAMPQNLSLRAVVPASLSHTVTANHAVHTSIGCHLGYHELPYVPPAPQAITIGVTNTVAAGTTTIRSGYYWMYQFSGGSNLSNLWFPDHSESLLQLSGSNPTNSESPYGLEFGEVLIWDGHDIVDVGNLGYTVQIGMYNSKPEFYTNYNQSVTNADCCFVTQPGSSPTWTTETEFDLPNDLYTIDGTSLTWNTAHPLYMLLDGQPGTAV